jgi:hypothetical protein
VDPIPQLRVLEPVAQAAEQDCERHQPLLSVDDVVLGAGGFSSATVVRTT